VRRAAGVDDPDHALVIGFATEFQHDRAHRRWEGLPGHPLSLSSGALQ
jgi:hypothetical protein